MSKKDFLSAMTKKNLSILIPTTDEEAGEVVQAISTPKASDKIATKKEPQKTKHKEGREEKPQKNSFDVASFRIHQEQLLSIKSLAFWERRHIQDVMQEAIDTFLKKIPKNRIQEAREGYKNHNKSQNSKNL